jgi:CBS domain-containing protein
MKAEEIMARDVLTVTPATTLDVAINLMLQRRVSGLPVVSDTGELVGIITEGDLLRRVETGTDTKRRSRLLEFLAGPGREASEFVHANSRRVGDLMTPGVISVAADATLDEVVDSMERHHIRRVPVVTGGKVVGVVSRADLLRALAVKLDVLPKPGGAMSDEAVESGLRAQLEASNWLSGTNIGINVKDGVVTLTGYIYDERTRKALIVAAQNAAGVGHVIDKLVWLDTTTGLVVP